MDIQATGLDSLEAAMVAKLAPEAYTAVIAVKRGAAGIGDIYDLSQRSVAQLANISPHGGFILAGTSSNPARAVVRALRPSLTSWCAGLPRQLRQASA